MYVEIKNNKILSWCKNAYLDYEYVDIDYSSFNPEEYEIQEGKLINITDTNEYKAKLEEKEKEEQKTNLQKQIDEFDKKRIRAVCEPSIKDEASGQTWLEYYTQKITSLRTEMEAL